VLVLAGITLVSAYLAGLAVRPWLIRQPPFGSVRKNFRGVTVPVVGGAVIVMGLLVAQTVGASYSSLQPQVIRGESRLAGLWSDVGAAASRLNLALTVLVLGFFVLGWVDDLMGDPRVKGLRGHLKALRSGIITTGSIKAGGGVVLALGAAWWWQSLSSLGETPAVGIRVLGTLADGLLVALSANLLNLLDLRPGRACKAYLIAWILLAAPSWTTPSFLVSSALAAATVAWLPADLGEKGMLGDAGANLLGSALGAVAALSLGWGTKLALLASLAAATLASERWSFTEAIERIRPLRWLDDLGRLPHRKNL
jgi:UDP-N-acetylmuramyl pentapeptide phosphotransferase/UDP-N-acetylglucosamine-1-phosphate transferase